MAVWSSVNFSDLTIDHRLDAEFYRPEYLSLDRILSRNRATPWGDLPGRFIVGPFGSAFLVENYLENSPYRYIRGRDVKPFFILEDQNCYIPPIDFDRLTKYQVKPGDLLVSVVGTIGAVSVITDDVQQAIFSCKSTAYRSESLNPYYLCAYLNSPTGQAYLIRMIRGHVQTGLNLPDLKKVPILRVNPVIERGISSFVRDAYLLQQQATGLLHQAESALNSALGLDRLDRAPRLFYKDRFSRVVAAGRFDAEYFSPRMQKVIEALSRDGLTIADVAPLKKRQFKPISGQPFEYIEIADVGGGGIAESKTVAGEEAPSRATWIVKPGDLITTTVRPIRRLSAIITPEQDGYVCSSGFAVLLPREVAPELLLTYLRLPLVAELLDLHTTASMYPAISTADLLRIPISLPDSDTRKEIVTKVRESFATDKESRRLLDTAKRAVEIAIEDGEEAARKFLDHEAK